MVVGAAAVAVGGLVVARASGAVRGVAMDWGVAALSAASGVSVARAVAATAQAVGALAGRAAALVAAVMAPARPLQPPKELTRSVSLHLATLRGQRPAAAGPSAFARCRPHRRRRSAPRQARCQH